MMAAVKDGVAVMRRTVATGRFVWDVSRRFTKKARITHEDGMWLKRRVEEMGPTYVKIGQFVASRNDIFDKELVRCLNELHDNVEPVPFDLLTANMPSAVSAVQSVPIASASIGQVHRGIVVSMRTSNGDDTGKKKKKRSEIIVKIRRPGIRARVRSDIDVMLAICNVLQAVGVVHIDELRQIVVEFDEFLMQEIDFRYEAKNTVMFRRLVADDPTIVVPSIVPGLCTEDVLVMKYVPHVKFAEAKERMTMEQRSRVAYRLMDVFVNHLIRDGIVHGDPHSGNVALTPDMRRFVFYDFGSVIRIDKQLRRQMLCLVFELMTGNIDAAVRLLQNMRHVSVRDVEGLRPYVAKYAEYMRTVDVSVFSSLVGETGGGGDKSNNAMDGSFDKLPVKLDGIIFRIIRVFGLVEGICKDLDPEFTYAGVFVKHVGVVVSDAEFIDYKIRSDVRKLFLDVTAIL